MLEIVPDETTYIGDLVVSMMRAGARSGQLHHIRTDDGDATQAVYLSEEFGKVSLTMIASEKERGLKIVFRHEADNVTITRVDGGPIVVTGTNFNDAVFMYATIISLETNHLVDGHEERWRATREKLWRSKGLR